MRPAEVSELGELAATGFKAEEITTLQAKVQREHEENVRSRRARAPFWHALRCHGEYGCLLGEVALQRVHTR